MFSNLNSNLLNYKYYLTLLDKAYINITILDVANVCAVCNKTSRNSNLKVCENMSYI